MKRSEVKTGYTWDLADIFPSVLVWEKHFVLASKAIESLGAYKGKLSETNKLLELLKKGDEAGLMVEKLYVFAKMNTDLDGANSAYVGLTRRAVSLIAQYNAAMSYVEPELTILPEETLDRLIYDQAFSDYDYFFKKIKKEKEHVLSAKEEMLIARYGELFGSYREIFEKIDNVDLPHPKVSDGENKVPLTHGSYSKLLQNPDRDVRKKAFSTFYKLYESRLNTIASCYAASVKCNNINASVRGYKSALEASMAGDDVPSAVYDKLLDSVNKGLPFLHDYVEYRRSSLGELHMYDMYVPLCGTPDFGSEYETAYETVLDALAPLGTDYREMLVRARDERWIDVEETENKRGGAYSWGVYGVHPYVLLNYAGTTHDLFTIAHELGHAMHSYYSDKAQPQAKADYSIFVAEVASTVNEVLACKYLIAKETDPENKKYLLSYYLDMMRTTFFRQAMFAEFEKQVHALDQKGEALTVDSLNRIYLKLNKKYYGSSVIHDKQIKCEWARIPHFYNAFYVYKYATGITSAVTLASSLLTGGAAALERYKKFLSAGGSKSPYEILRDAGVDLCTDEPYDTARKEFRETLVQLMNMD